MDSEKLKVLLDKAHQKRQSGTRQNSIDQQYSLVYKALEVPGSIRKAIHQISPIGFEKVISTLWPPCAIPLWITLSGIIICEWRHWFNDRKSVIIRFYPEYSMAVEWARSYEQLGYLILQDILDAEAEMSSEVEEVGECLNVQDLDEVFQIWKSYGDRPLGFAKHKVFHPNLPQSCFEDDLSDYRGDFPTIYNTSNVQLGNACSFELHNRFKDGMPVTEIRQQVGASNTSPEWLRSSQQSTVFEKVFNEGNLAGAWMSLCSSGWKYSDAKDALSKLAQKTDNLRFKILAESWCSLPLDKDASY